MRVSRPSSHSVYLQGWRWLPGSLVATGMLEIRLITTQENLDVLLMILFGVHFNIILPLAMG